MDDVQDSPLKFGDSCIHLSICLAIKYVSNTRASRMRYKGKYFCSYEARLSLSSQVSGAGLQACGSVNSHREKPHNSRLDKARSSRWKEEDLNLRPGMPPLVAG